MITNIDFTFLLLPLSSISSVMWEQPRMEINDIAYVLLYSFLIYIYAYIRRIYLTDSITKRYYIPALTLKIIGAIMVGIIYQFYYGEGDTFKFYKHSKRLFEIFWEESPIIWFKIILQIYDIDTVPYNIMYMSPRNLTVIKIASIFGVIGLNSYAVIAIFFASASFFGLWAMFNIFYKTYPHLHKEFAISILFIPSVVFWGSGLLKDTVTVACIAWLFYGFHKAFIQKRKILKSIIIIIVCSHIVLKFRYFVLLAFFPPITLWIFDENIKRIKNQLIKLFLTPFLFIIALIIIYLGMGNYDFNKIIEGSTKTADYIYSVSVENDGSAYKIHGFDGTLGGFFLSFPEAVNVSLFRPYLTEVKKPIMLMSSLESTAFLLFTLWVIFKVGPFKIIKKILTNPLVRLCFVFSIGYAFAVGASTFNFGSLVRYKIPMMPFYLCGLFIILYEDKYISTQKQYNTK